MFWRGFYTSLNTEKIEKNVGITNDFDMAHVARHANYMGSLTTPVPCFFACWSQIGLGKERVKSPVAAALQTIT